ncbi:hypothetical protein TGPRC2_268430 [Toxoplasma gondii TgCatPRC2]|uniref:Uncharacterized protein n=2 Tax=Toxoplasma gondii TaxID=5811 RepID=A0A151HN93_TOXGO|nr:hypothetical protein TGARI_268430 [Toxoplasma gondii ARI]KYK70826.1 hypothetical protein TGPRC2_268430 [Toxoplasma gondii TgCatPRC2]
MAGVNDYVQGAPHGPPPDLAVGNPNGRSAPLHQTSEGTPGSLHPSSPDVKLKSSTPGKSARPLPGDEFVSLTTTADSSTPAAVTPTAAVPLPSVASRKDRIYAREPEGPVSSGRQGEVNNPGRDAAPGVAPLNGERLDVASAQTDRPSESQTESSRFATNSSNQLVAVSPADSPSSLQLISFESTEEASLCGARAQHLDAPPGQTDQGARRVPLHAPNRSDSAVDSQFGSSDQTTANLQQLAGYLRNGNSHAQSGVNAAHMWRGNSGEDARTPGDCGLVDCGSSDAEAEAQKLMKSLIAERDLYKAAFGAANEELEELQGSHRELQKALGEADRRLLHSELLLQRQQRQIAATEQGSETRRVDREDVEQIGGEPPTLHTLEGSHSSAEVIDCRAISRYSGQGRGTTPVSSCSKSPSTTEPVSNQKRPDTQEARYREVARGSMSRNGGNPLSKPHPRCASEYVLSPAVRSSNDSQLGERVIDVFTSRKPRSSLLTSQLPQGGEFAYSAADDVAEFSGGASRYDGRPRNRGSILSFTEGRIRRDCGVHSYRGQKAAQSGGEAGVVMEGSRHSAETATRLRTGLENNHTASAASRGPEDQTMLFAEADRYRGVAAASGTRRSNGRGRRRSSSGEESTPPLRSVSCEGVYGVEADLGNISSSFELLRRHSPSTFPQRGSVRDCDGDENGEGKTSFPSLLQYEAPETAWSRADKKDGALHDNSETLRKSIVDSYFWLHKLSASISSGEYPSVELLVRGVEEQQQLIRVAQTMEEEREQYVDAVANLHAELRSVRDEACIYLLAHQQQATDLQQEADDAHAAADFWLENHLRFMRKWQRIGYGALIYLPSARVVSDEDTWNQQQQLFQTGDHCLMIAGDCEIDPLESPVASDSPTARDLSACKVSQSLRAVDAICAAQVILHDEEEAESGETHASEAAEDLSWAMPDDFVRCPGSDRDSKKVERECFQKRDSNIVEAARGVNHDLQAGWLQRRGERMLLWFLD